MQMIVTFWFLILTDRYGLRIVTHINRVCPEISLFLKLTNIFTFIESFCLTK